MAATPHGMFLYFDLGNVLLYFDHDVACRQMAEVASDGAKQITAADVRAVLFDSGLEDDYEAGKLSTDELYQRFSEATGTRPDRARLIHAASDIFTPNVSIRPVLGALKHARCRLGLLSNTNEIHWQHVCAGRYAWVPDSFETLALSFEMGSIKPNHSIFQRAAEFAGVAPAEVFYVDDRAENVAAAREVGFDAVAYTDTPTLVTDLQSRGVGLNY